MNVLVMAPNLGRDLRYVSDVDPRIRVLDGNDPPVSDELLAQADVLVVGFPVPRELACRAPRLRWAHHVQAGVSNMHGTDLWSSDVLLTSSRGAVSATSIAEYALAAAFFSGRGLQEAARQKAAGELGRRGYAGMTALAGATMGIVGLGGIGGEVARLARAVGMRVVAIRRSATTVREDVDGVDLLLPPDHLLELAAQSDFLAICAQRTPETEGLIGREVLAAMKPSALLINVARGELVDEQALIEAIENGKIRGAVLDVYEGELDGKAPRRELVELPQVLLTPHISGRGDQVSPEPARRLLAENLRRFLDGRELLNVVDRERGY